MRVIRNLLFSGRHRLFTCIYPTLLVQYVFIYFADYVDHITCNFIIHITPILTDDYIVFGKRQSIEVEPSKSTTLVRGDGPYKWI